MAADRRRGRPTLADVGRRAGVSGAAVSYVLNGRAAGQVSAETAERVWRAATELDYRPDRAAQALRTRRNGIVGLVMGEVHHNIPPVGAMAGAHDAARAAGQSLLVVNAPDTRAGLEEAFADLLGRQVDSIVVAVAGTRAIAVPTAVSDTPVVLVNCFPDTGDVPCVLPDEEAGGRAATEHVLRHGHRRVAFLGGVERMWATGLRAHGHRAALRAAGAPVDEDLVRFGNYRIGSGHELARQILRLPDPPTALVCGNDRMALGACVAVAEAGLRVPEDISVVGYDDEPQLAAEVVPPLSTIRLPYEEMGHWAVRRLLDGTHADLVPRTLMPCPVVERSSVGPPPAGGGGTPPPRAQTARR